MFQVVFKLKIYAAGDIVDTMKNLLFSLSKI